MFLSCFCRYIDVFLSVYRFNKMTKKTAEHRILIENLLIKKQRGARQMITLNKAWSKTSLNRREKINVESTIALKPGNGCPNSVKAEQTFGV